MREHEVTNCARCGNDHRIVMFKHFKGNYVSCHGFDYQYWGWCPTNIEPILLSVQDEELPLDGADEGKTEESQECFVCGCSSKCQDSKLGIDEIK